MPQRPTRPGPVGADMALSFNGSSDSVRVTRPVADDFTLEAWIRTSDPGVTGTGIEFFDGPAVFYSDTPRASQRLRIVDPQQESVFGGGNPNGAVRSSVSDVATGQWVHVAAVRVKSSGTVSVFVNGNQEASTPGLNTASLDSTPSMDIGANIGNARFFTGIIDEVRAWSIARTSAEIQATMRTRLVGNEPGLVGYWRFDDGTGMTAVDSSPTHNDGSSFGEWRPGRRPRVGVVHRVLNRQWSRAVGPRLANFDSRSAAWNAAVASLL